VDLDPRGRRLRAALAAVLVRDRARELDLVHQWLDTWAGLGLVSRPKSVVLKTRK
jgi:hypothetical protein